MLSAQQQQSTHSVRLKSSPQALPQPQPHYDLNQTLKPLTDYRGGVKNGSSVPAFVDVVQRERSLKGRLIILVSVKLTSDTIQRQLLGSGLLYSLVGWLKEAVAANKVDFGKVVLGVMGLLPVSPEDGGMGEVLEVLEHLNQCQGLQQSSDKLVKKWSVFKTSKDYKVPNIEDENEDIGFQQKRSGQSINVDPKRRKISGDVKVEVKKAETESEKLKTQQGLSPSLKQKGSSNFIATSPLDTIMVDVPGGASMNIPVTQQTNDSLKNDDQNIAMDVDIETVEKNTPKKTTRISWAPEKQLTEIRYFRVMDPAIAIQTSNSPSKGEDSDEHEQHFLHHAQQEHREEYHAQQMKQNMIRQLHQMSNQIPFYKPEPLDLKEQFSEWEVCRGENSTEAKNPALSPKPRILYESLDEIPDTPLSPAQTTVAPKHHSKSCIVTIIPFEEVSDEKPSAEISDTKENQAAQKKNQTHITYSNPQQNSFQESKSSQNSVQADTEKSEKELQIQLSDKAASSNATENKSKACTPNKPLFMLKPCDGYYELFGSTISLKETKEKLGYVFDGEKKLPIYLQTKSPLIQPLLCNFKS
eukprot:TRINITY_DN2354_c0_g2_i1.p1 TRINITY_DN2354_c0_g2~~TRINITY_DN2354_c0_g2_i1.p1  ORF type:complete len:584 (-),score=95.39 TRINITY_DN2354_c0_g2_i1:240-1991(-)